MRSVHLVQRLFAVGLLALTVAGCSAVADALPKGGPIAQNMAEDYARMASGVAVTPVAVVSSRLSTYGAERPSGRAAKADAKVWVVVLSGMFFPEASCFVALPVYNFGASPTPVPRPCPSPAGRERVILDANWGTLLEVIPGG
jgi:hypothetical protein